MAHQANPAVIYLYPREGTALWTDKYFIPANSPHKRAAEALIDFLLRPEIGAQVVELSRIAPASEAALPLVRAEIRDSPVIFPTVDLLRRSHFYAPLSAEGEPLYAGAWARLMSESP